MAMGTGRRPARPDPDREWSGRELVRAARRGMERYEGRIRWLLQQAKAGDRAAGDELLARFRLRVLR